MNGKWTMVYDEGFAMEFEELSFFAFSNYEIVTDEDSIKTYKSKCYSTCVGWYRNKDASQWGCYRAQKIGRSPSTVTYTTTTDSKDSSIINKEKVVSISNRIEENIIENVYKGNRQKTTNRSIHYKKQRNNQQLIKSFLSLKESSELNLLDSSFNMHHLYVERLNKLKKSWHAEVNKQFKNLSIKDLNKIAGIPRISQIRFSEKKTLNLKGKQGEDIAMFPKNFDWVEKVRPAGSQGSCGSCYALSTIRMVEARLRILYNENINLSVQHTLDCSFYNQGCNGGYPYLVMKYGKENLFIPEKCSVYKGSKGKCESTCDLERVQYLYGMINYNYVGGSYGQCSEKKIMEEVYKNGPIVVSFEPDYNFMMYKSGVYHSLDESNWMSQGLPKPEWQKVDHSVLLVGWGEDKEVSEKYWILQNTWGPEWGEKGFFRVRRGVDEMGIESICESGIPIVVDNLKKQEILPQNNLILN